MNIIANIVLAVVFGFFIYQMDTVSSPESIEAMKAPFIGEGRSTEPLNAAPARAQAPLKAAHAADQPAQGGGQGSSSFEVGFSRGGRDPSALESILRLIQNARSEILVAAYAFTSPDIQTALEEAGRRGVKVYIVMDKEQNCRGREAEKTAATVERLNASGATVRMNGRYAIFHHKFMVVDMRHVETGSFNYSAAATKSNAENVLILRDVPAIVHKYRAEWSSLFNEAAQAVCRDN